MFLNLMAEIKKSGMSQKEFAKIIEINETTFSKKINSKADFTLIEMQKISNFFGGRLAFDYLFEEFSNS